MLDHWTLWSSSWLWKFFHWFSLIIKFVCSSYCLGLSSSTQFDYNFLEFMDFIGKLRNEVGCRMCKWWSAHFRSSGWRNEMGAECANGGWWAVFRNSGWRSGETLGFIIFVFSIFDAVILQINLWSGWSIKLALYGWEALACVVGTLTLLIFIIFFYSCCSEEDIYWIVEPMEPIAVDYWTYYKALCFVTFPFTVFLMRSSWNGCSLFYWL